jgi:hypothetical protein
VLSAVPGETALNGGESGATGPTRVADVEVCKERTGRSVEAEVDSGWERGDGERGALEMEEREWKKLDCALKEGFSRARCLPSAAAVTDEEAAEVGMGICRSGGSRRAILQGRDREVKTTGIELPTTGWICAQRWTREALWSVGALG